MKAARLHEIGNGPEGLRYEDVPDPEPGPGEIVVRLHSAALNRRDVFITYGQYPGAKPDLLPVILGSDGSGEVVSRGEDARGSEEGEEVIINPALYWGDDPHKADKEYRILGLPDDGTYAQFVKVPSDYIYPKPSHLSHAEAAAIPLAGLTAYRAMVSRGNVKENETVIIPGVGGGVAPFLVQIAVAHGARVFVTSSSDDKIERAKELGAEDGVNYKAENWSKELRSMTGGADLSVDSIGGEVFDALVSIAKPGGRIVTFGSTGGPVPKLVMPKIFLKWLDVLGTTMGSPEEFAAMLNLYEEHRLKPIINESFSLEAAATAQKHMESGEGIGKIVLDIPA